jgi:hypothetical protein
MLPSVFDFADTEVTTAIGRLQEAPIALAPLDAETACLAVKPSSVIGAGRVIQRSSIGAMDDYICVEAQGVSLQCKS